MKNFIVELEKRNNHQKGEWIKKFLSERNISFQLQNFRSYFQNGENIIIDYPFDKVLTKSTKRILLTAHYDAVIWAPGANDNGSGVAVLLELITALNNQKPALSVPMRFVFFDLEDSLPSCLGSSAYVKEFGFDDIIFLYNLEMVGMGDVPMLWLHSTETLDSDWVKPLALALKQLSQEVIVGPAKFRLSNIIPRLGFTSDHMSFIQHDFFRACSLTMVPKVDLQFKEAIEKRKFLRFIGSALRYLFTKKGDFPVLLRHYHSKDDRSEFVQNETLQKVFNALWKTVTNK